MTIPWHVTACVYIYVEACVSTCRTDTPRRSLYVSTTGRLVNFNANSLSSHIQNENIDNAFTKYAVGIRRRKFYEFEARKTYVQL